jgi:hypothetical protein
MTLDDDSAILTLPPSPSESRLLLGRAAQWRAPPALLNRAGIRAPRCGDEAWTALFQVSRNSPTNAEVADFTIKGYDASPHWFAPHPVRDWLGAASMFRTSILALIFGFTSITVFAEDARQLTCSGMMIEPSAMSQSPETVILTLGPAQKVALERGQGVVNARKVSDNKIQLKFRTKDFEGEYFHYTGDLFFIYKSGHLMKLTCQKRES